VTATARAHGVPVFFVRQDGPAEDNVAPGTPGWELDERVHVEPADVHLRKGTCDAFFETGLERELRSRGIDRLVVAGYATEFCLDSTVRCGSSKGFEIFVVEDAHTTNDSAILTAEQVILFHNWAWSNASSPRNIGIVRASEVDRVLLPAARWKSKQS
jgi:nicotinamidase-related amidase